MCGTVPKHRRTLRQHSPIFTRPPSMMPGRTLTLSRHKEGKPPGMVLVRSGMPDTGSMGSPTQELVPAGGPDLIKTLPAGGGAPQAGKNNLNDQSTCQPCPLLTDLGMLRLSGEPASRVSLASTSPCRLAGERPNICQQPLLRPPMSVDRPDIMPS